MKNKTKIISALRVLLVCGFLLGASFLRAQNCNITITNNLTCDVQLNISFFESIPTCSACAGNPITVTVTKSGGSTSLNCANLALWACSGTICDISVTFTSPFTTGAFLYSGGTQSLSGVPVSCGGTVSQHNIYT